MRRSVRGEFEVDGDAELGQHLRDLRCEGEARSGGGRQLDDEPHIAAFALQAAEEIAAVIRQAAEFVPNEKIVACTNYGMAPMRRDFAVKKLEALAEGAALARAGE